MTTQTSAQRKKGRTGMKGVVARVTDAAEDLHRSVAGFPLDLLEEVDALKRPVARVRKLQERAIKANYELARGIEREIARLARGGAGARKAGGSAAKKPAHAKRAVRREARPVRAAEPHARPVHPAPARQAG